MKEYKESKEHKGYIEILDTTLRDGEQARGISYTIQDKITIAKLLDELGVQYIEGGWPAANPKTYDFFKQMRSVELKNAKLMAFGSTRRFKNKVQEDENLRSLIDSGASGTVIFGKVWDLHVKEGLNISLEDNLLIIRDSISYLKDNGLEVIFDAEHFFDGYKSHPEYALETLIHAEQSGADRIVLCDTNGGTLPYEVESMIKEVRSRIRVKIGIHAHNDSGLAVANSVEAVWAGATQIHGTINGYGERCGNTNLCTLLPILKLKMKLDCISEESLQRLTKLGRHVAEIANMAFRDEEPFIGKNAFAHKGGVHVSAILKNSKMYEHISPELVGNHQEVSVSELAGVSNIFYKAQYLGLVTPENEKEAKTILFSLMTKIKLMEQEGMSFEEGESSLELLLRRSFGQYDKFFHLEGFRIFSDAIGSGDKLTTEATIKCRVGNQTIHTAANGNGPVSAIDMALHKALEVFYPCLKTLHLIDYKVRVLDSSDGTGAKVRVLIKSTDGEEIWGTVGASANIIEASWSALVDGIEYKLFKDNGGHHIA